MSRIGRTRSLQLYVSGNLFCLLVFFVSKIWVGEKGGVCNYRGFIPEGDRVLSYNIIVVPNRH
jgi:hypothetical protein